MTKIRDFPGELELIAQQLRRKQVLQLKDEMKLSFAEIGRRMGFTWQRAQKLYNDAKREADTAEPAS